MRYTFLGTSSGTPTRDRNVSGAALRLEDGAVWMFDCGEATQHRLLETDLRPGRIEAIFITHLHGDHCYGLPGLLACITVHGRKDEVLRVIGPRGLKEWIAVTRRVSQMGLAYPIEVIELDEPELTQIPSWRDIKVTALPLNHRITTFGYLLEEDPRRGRFDVAKAERLGIDGPMRGRLAKGESLQLPDGQTIGPTDILGPDRPGRRLGILGDTTDAMQWTGVLQNCDFIVHECTYAADRAEKARRWGHATTTEAAALAAAVNPRVLALNHFSSRYTVTGGDQNLQDLHAELRDAAPADTRIVMADDFLHVEIPLQDA